MFKNKWLFKYASGLQMVKWFTVLIEVIYMLNP